MDTLYNRLTIAGSFAVVLGTALQCLSVIIGTVRPREVSDIDFAPRPAD